MLYSYNGISPKLKSPAFIAPTCTIIGNVEIRKNAIIFFGVIIRAEKGKIIIGENTIIEDNVIIHGSNVEIGNNVIIQHNSCIHGSIIEDNVIIGTNCTISAHVHIKEGSMILNNTLIHPGKIIKKRKKAWIKGNKLKMKGTITEKLIERNKKYIDTLIETSKNYSDLLEQL